MKILTTLTLALLGVVMFSSCEKETPQPNTPTSSVNTYTLTSSNTEYKDTIKYWYTYRNTNNEFIEVDSFAVDNQSITITDAASPSYFQISAESSYLENNTSYVVLSNWTLYKNSVVIKEEFNTSINYTE